ncbi:DUF835 domain-containing protein [Thermococcus sp.]
MKLIVPLYQLVYDVAVLTALVYVWYFFLKRWNRYAAELRTFVRYTALFIFFGVLGRTIDLINDFVVIPHAEIIYAVCYSISIIGVIYTTVLYVLLLERSYIPEVKEPEKGLKESEKLKGAFVVMGSRGKIFEVIDLIRSLKAPALVFTRNPYLYQGLGEFVGVVWITQATDKGIPPTHLHVIQDQVIKFIKEKERAIIVMDCIEYLLLYNEFPAVFKFLVNLKDHVVASGNALVMFVEEDTLDDRQKALILREFEPL